MKIHTDIEQGTAQWLALRAGKVTASEIDALLTPLFKIKEGEGPETYLDCKIGEAWTPGEVDPGFTSFATEQGQILEDEARKWYAFEFNERLHDVGFCEHDDGRCGCSPDALIGEYGGLEIKCPARHTHVRYLRKQTLPKEYAAQVHMSLYVTGRKWWKFVSYRRRFPALVLTIERDEAICAKIHEALTGFYERFDAEMSKLRASAE